MILLRRFTVAMLSLPAHAVCHSAQWASLLSLSLWAMLWEMSAVKACVRCVGVLALALELMLRFMPHKAAGMYRNWRKWHGKLILCPIPPFSPPFSHFYYSFFISPPLFSSLCWVTMLSFNPLQAGLLDRNKRLMCLFMWLWTSQDKKPLPVSCGEQWKWPGAVTGQV